MTPSPSGGGPFLARTSEITMVARGCLAPCGLTSLPSIDRPHPLSAPKHGVDDDQCADAVAHASRLVVENTHATRMDEFFAVDPRQCCVVRAINWRCVSASICPLSSAGLGLGKLHPPQQCLLLCHSLTHSFTVLIALSLSLSFLPPRSVIPFLTILVTRYTTAFICSVLDVGVVQSLLLGIALTTRQNLVNDVGNKDLQ